MFQRFLMKKMLKSQLKNVPEDQQEKLLGMIEKNPDLFMKIAKEVKQKMDNGQSQMSASMEVMKKYQAELKEAMAE